MIGRCSCSPECGPDRDGGHWHAHDGRSVWAGYLRYLGRPAPDATAGDGLRAAIAVCAWHATDARTRYGNCAECARPGRHPMTGPEVTVADRLRSELLAEFGARFQPRSGMSERAVERLADAVLALPALRDVLAAHAPGKCVTVDDANRVLADSRAETAHVLAAAAHDAEKVRRVRELADQIDDVNNRHIWSPDIADRIRRALDGTP